MLALPGDSEGPDSADSAHTADCCRPDPRIALHFDRDTRKRTETGELPPMQPITERLYDALSDVDSLRPTILELGSGTGALSVALVGRGAARVDGIDLSPGSVAAARQRAAQAGVDDRAAFEVGDGAAARLEPHDWVILDRVICCYGHFDELLTNALAAARTRFCFTVPESRGWRGLAARAAIFVENVTRPFRPAACPGYVHDVRAIETRLAAAGFRLRSSTRGYWYTAVWDRAAT
jgi:magnesium-protoporphyrin O-methyltransferase